jgi:hypothetical protein
MLKDLSYLLRSRANAARLFRSIESANGGRLVEHEVIETREQCTGPDPKPVTSTSSAN